MTNRKSLLLITILVLLGAVGFIVYLFLSGKEVEQPSTQFELPEGQDMDRFFDEAEISSDKQTLFTSDRFRRISERPVAGYITFASSTSPTSTKSFVRFVDRQSGNIYELRENENVPIKISPFTLAHVQEALWVGKNSVVLRTLNEDSIIKTQIISLLPNGEGSYSTDRTSLEDDIRSISTSHSGYIGYIRSSREIPEYVLWDNTNKKIISTTILPIFDMNVQVLESGDSIISTKAGKGVIGNSYKISKGATTLLPFIRKQPALEILSNKDHSLSLYSTSDKSGQSSFISTSAGSARMSLETLPEKCTWSSLKELYCSSIDQPNKKVSLPDDWYKGKIGLSGSMYKIIPDNIDAPEYLFSSSDPSNPFDIIHPQLSSHSRLYFIDKNTLSLWEYSL